MSLFLLVLYSIRENYNSYYERGRICMRNLERSKSVEFGTAGPRPASSLFVFIFI